MRKNRVMPVKVFSPRNSERIKNRIAYWLAEILPPEYIPESGLKKLYVPGNEALQRKKQKGIPAERLKGEVEVKEHSNDEMEVIVKSNVRGHCAVVIFTQNPPVHKSLWELFLLLNALFNTGISIKNNLLLVFPYFVYSRGDKKEQSGGTIGGEMLARLLSAMGVREPIILEPHNKGICKDFKSKDDDIYGKDIYANNLIIYYLMKEEIDQGSKDDFVFVSPDAGALSRYKRKFTKELKIPPAFIHKYRKGDEEVVFDQVVGDVKGKNCIIRDDEILTGGTIIGTAEQLKKAGANSVIAALTHPILRSKSKSPEEIVQRLENSVVDKFIVTDSVAVRHKLKNAKKFTILPIGKLLAEAIKYPVIDRSLGEFYGLDKVPDYFVPPENL